MFLALLTYHTACFFMTSMGPVCGIGYGTNWAPRRLEESLRAVRAQDQARVLYICAHTHPVVIAPVAWPGVQGTLGTNQRSKQLLPHSAQLFLLHTNFPA